VPMEVARGGARMMYPDFLDELRKLIGDGR
jgi:hypothetical protein